MDIYYDHFLAKNWDDYSQTPLKQFAEDFYALLERNYDLLPLGTRRMLPYMVADNWLYNYSHLEGISRVLHGMNRRTQNKSKMNHAIVDLEEHYSDFENEFRAFFQELITFSRLKYNELCES